MEYACGKNVGTYFHHFTLYLFGNWKTWVISSYHWANKIRLFGKDQGGSRKDDLKWKRQMHTKFVQDLFLLIKQIAAVFEKTGIVLLNNAMKYTTKYSDINSTKNINRKNMILYHILKRGIMMHCISYQQIVNSQRNCQPPQKLRRQFPRAK